MAVLFMVILHIGTSIVLFHKSSSRVMFKHLYVEIDARICAYVIFTYYKCNFKYKLYMILFMYIYSILLYIFFYFSFIFLPGVINPCVLILLLVKFILNHCKVLLLNICQERVHCYDRIKKFWTK